jgi:hypothetical protein
MGPIEPALQNIPCTILAKPQIAQQNFVLHQAGLYALQQSRALAKSLLASGMMKGRTQQEIEDAVQKLASRDVYYSHGSAISHAEATSPGLTVQYLAPDDPLWQRLWLLYCMYDHDCRKSRYLKVFEGRNRSTAVAALPV